MSRYLVGILIVIGAACGSVAQAPLALADETAQTAPPPPSGGTRDCERSKDEAKTS